MTSKRTTHKKAELKEPVSASSPTTPPRLLEPSGTWVALRFLEGADTSMISALFIESVLGLKGQRTQGKTWVVMLGEFFMLERCPVVMLSADLAKPALRALNEVLEMLGPVAIRRGRRSSFAFQGRVLVWVQDDFERAYRSAVAAVTIP